MGRTRTYRRAQRERVIANRLREVEQVDYFVKRGDRSHVVPGKYAKRKSFDCGRARCMTCHSEKLIGIMRHRYSFDWRKDLVVD